ncbi:hypothetical protein MJO28_002821 [Puccinia striiformis f. sp. tritici]|uniref:Uncharacterized protein n=1 Tax=Puccinia striiformis f. sp. tritici TaxID=168172 RepID=A0ACC0EUF3_9BASI|nr:hypothetical protein MJO28_002821 [Puccinia striiformis f. sp. tritici]
MADLEAQIQAATEQLAKEKTLFAQQTEETKPEKPRTTKKIKIVEPLTSWDEEPSLEEKKVTMFPPPPPKVLKKIRPTKLVRPLTAEKPAENDLAHVENKPIKPPFRLKIILPPIHARTLQQPKSLLCLLRDRFNFGSRLSTLHTGLASCGCRKLIKRLAKRHERSENNQECA